MAKEGFWNRTFHLYYDGFRSMTLGKTLWAVILIKLFIIFVVLKIFFFPNFLSSHAEKGEEADFVATELLDRVAEPPKLGGWGAEQKKRDNNNHIINRWEDEHSSDPQPPNLGG